MPGRTHSREFKLTIVRQVADGEKRPAQICREHNLDERVLLRWRKEYATRGEAAFTPREGGGVRGPRAAGGRTGAFLRPAGAGEPDLKKHDVRARHAGA